MRYCNALFLFLAACTPISPEDIESSGGPRGGLESVIARRPVARQRRYAAPPTSSDSGTLFDFTTGSVPAGVVANTVGDTIYRTTSASTQETLTPGSGIGVFENRGRGVGMLVGAGASDRIWRNLIQLDMGSNFWQQLNSWNHNGAGNITRTADSVVARPQGGTGAILLDAHNAATQGYIVSTTTSEAGQGFGSFWVRDYDATAPTSEGNIQGGAGGSLENMRLGTGQTWRRVRIQGASANYTIYPAGPYATNGFIGRILVTNAMQGSDYFDLPLVVGATTGSAQAYDNTFNDPSLFVVNGALRAQGTYMQLHDGTNHPFGSSSALARTLFSITTPEGQTSLRAEYSVAGSSSVDWILKVGGADFLIAEYDSPGGGALPTTSPGVGGSYLSRVYWACGYDASAGLAYLRIEYPGSAVTVFTTTGVSTTLTNPTAAYIHTSTAQQNGYPALVRTVTAGASTFTPSPIILLSDSLNDITGVAGYAIRPSNFVFTDDEAEAGSSIEARGAHGFTLDQALTDINAFAAAFPSAVAAARFWWVDLGWNVFPSQTNATTRTQMNALLNRLAALNPNAPIRLWIPSPAKAGVSATAQTRYEEFETDVLAGYYTQATAVDFLSRTTAPSMNDGAYGGTAYNLRTTYAYTDLQHYSLAGKQAKGALYRLQAAADGI